MNRPEQKKKILFLITKSNFGGAQRYVFDLAVATHKKGYDVAVALGGTGEAEAPIGALDTLLTEHEIRTIHVKNFMRDVSFMRDIRAVFELIAMFRRERPDVLHASSSKAGGLGAFAGRVCNIRKIIFTSHGLTFNESWRPRLQRLIIMYFTWITMLLSHTSIMISNETYTTAKRMPFLKKKVALIYNGVEAIELCEKDAARKALDLTDIPEHALILGTIAELHPNKNLGSVLDAFALLPSEHKERTHFVVIGAGELEAQLKETAQAHDITAHVHFLGNVPSAATYLTAFDIFILPSFKEGLPYVLLEAGYAGLPVIASNISGNTDIVTHEENGLLIDPHDPVDIKQAIATLVTDDAQRSALGNALAKTISKTFSIEQMVEETITQYE